jgi:hypothetical protein
MTGKDKQENSMNPLQSAKEVKQSTTAMDIAAHYETATFALG